MWGLRGAAEGDDAGNIGTWLTEDDDAAAGY